jgi:hypothetical protein
MCVTGEWAGHGPVGLTPTVQQSDSSRHSHNGPAPSNKVFIRNFTPPPPRDSSTALVYKCFTVQILNAECPALTYSMEQSPS